MRWGKIAGKMLDISADSWVGTPTNTSGIKKIGIEKYREISAATVPFPQPTAIPVPCDADIESVKCSGGLTVAKTMSGELYAIGANRYGQCGIDDKVIFNLEPRRVALIDSASRFDLGFQHGVALTDEGKVFVWGKGLRGQLGQGREIERSLIPIEVKFDDAIVDVSCGMNHSCRAHERRAGMGMGKVSK